MHRLIDTHAHLEEIEELNRALDEARDAGVVAINAVGSDYASNQRVLELARQYKGLVFPSLGLHPWGLGQADLDHDLAFIEAHINEIIGIGEIGLDYHKGVIANASKEQQKAALRRLLDLAHKYSKPVNLHSRYAWRDTLDMVTETGTEKAVFHWFTGPSSVLRDILEHGYYLSATPALEYHEEHRRAIKESPLEKLLLETDAPTVYWHGSEFEFRARPSDIVRPLQAVAKIKDLPEDRIAAITTENALRLFPAMSPGFE